MNEPRRLNYLQAMGIDSYVSRAQLPGAAPTQRLALLRTPPLQTRAPTTAPTAPTAPPVPGVAPTPQRTPPPEMPRLGAVEKKPESKPAAQAARAPEAPTQPAVRCNLVCVFVGGVAWLESLDGRPLAREQLQLIHAMARAVHGEVAAPKVAQFDWPMHNNHQLDQGVDAARAALAAFLQRHIEEQKCRALLVLGSTGGELVEGEPLGNITRVNTHSTLEMLEQPACKRQVWSDLQPIVLRA